MNKMTTNTGNCNQTENSGASDSWSGRRESTLVPRVTSGGEPDELNRNPAMGESSAVPELDAVDLVMERARLGDARAFGELYERSGGAIYRFFCWRLDDPEVAADLTADVFMRAHQAIQNGRPWRESFVSWLYQIARHRLIDHIRVVARRPQCELTDDFPGADGLHLDETIDQQLVAQEIAAAMCRIRPGYAQILQLRYRNGLSHAESGALLHRNASAVKVTHHRAVKALRKQLLGNPVVESWVRDGSPAGAGLALQL